MTDPTDAPIVPLRPARGPSPRLRTRLALGNGGNRPRPLALTEQCTPAQAFVGPTLTPNDLDIDPTSFEPEWDEALEDAFFSRPPEEVRQDFGFEIEEVDTFPPVEERVVFARPLEEEPEDDDDLEEWVRPRSRWPAVLFASAAAAAVIGLAGFGFGMALEAHNSGASLAIPSLEAWGPATDAVDAVEEQPPAMPSSPLYPLKARPIPVIGADETTPDSRTAQRRARRARRASPSRRAPTPVAAPPPPDRAAPMSVRALQPAVSVSALPPAE